MAYNLIKEKKSYSNKVVLIFKKNKEGIPLSFSVDKSSANYADNVNKISQIENAFYVLGSSFQSFIVAFYDLMHHKNLNFNESTSFTFLNKKDNNDLVVSYTLSFDSLEFSTFLDEVLLDLNRLSQKRLSSSAFNEIDNPVVANLLHKNREYMVA